MINKLMKYFSKIKYRKVQRAELRWWKKKGVVSGKKHYFLYKKIFDFDKFDFSDKVAIDVGGGMYPIHLDFDCKRKILIEPLINEYKKIENYKLDNNVEYYESFEQMDQAKEISDVIFCFNALDHALDPKLLISQIHMCLKPNGLFFVYSHIDNPLGGPTHPHNISLSDYRNLLNKKFKIIDEFNWNDNRWKDISKYPAFIAICEKI